MSYFKKNNDDILIDIEIMINKNDYLLISKLIYSITKLKYLSLRPFFTTR